MKIVPAGHFERRYRDGRTRSNRRAFNFVELLVVMLIIGTISTLTFASINKTLPASRLRGKTNEVSTFFQQARLGAIKNGYDVSVEVEDYTVSDKTQVLIAYLLKNGGVKDELARLEIGSPERKALAHLGGVSPGSTDSSKSNTFKDGKLIYKPTGMAENLGALRFSIGTGDHQNTIEVAVPSLGGQPVLRKYIKPGDRPGSGTQEFFEASHHGTEWQWTWY